MVHNVNIPSIYQPNFDIDGLLSDGWGVYIGLWRCEVWHHSGRRYCWRPPLTTVVTMPLHPPPLQPHSSPLVALQHPSWQHLTIHDKFRDKVFDIREKMSTRSKTPLPSGARSYLQPLSSGSISSVSPAQVKMVVSSVPVFRARY